MKKLMLTLMIAGLLAAGGAGADRPDWAGNDDPGSGGQGAVSAGDVAGNARDANRTELRTMRQEMRREIRRSLRHEQQQGVHARERRGEDLEAGRTVIDVHGNRVRVEKYFSRPGSNQIRTRILNTRPDLDNRIDESVWTGTFNRDLPDDLRGIPRHMWGRVGTEPPDYYLTNVMRVDSSGGNNITVAHDGGWLYEPPVAALADTGSPGGPAIPPGQADRIRLFTVVFDDERVSVNGVDKIWRHRVNHDARNNVFGDIQIFHPKSDLTGLGHAVTVRTGDRNGDGVMERWMERGTEWDLARLRHQPVTTMEPGQFHVTDRLEFADGTWLVREQYRINDEGHVIGHGAPLWNANHEVVHGASEFGVDAAGQPRTIDIVVTPGPAVPLAGEVRVE